MLMMPVSGKMTITSKATTSIRGLFITNSPTQAISAPKTKSRSAFIARRFRSFSAPVPSTDRSDRPCLRRRRFIVAQAGRRRDSGLVNKGQTGGPAMANAATQDGGPDAFATAARSTDGPAFALARPLPAALLYNRCSPADLPFALTSEFEEVPGLIGQERAVEAISLAMRMRGKGYNVYALGPSGTGRHSQIEALLRKQAEREPTPPDWCYVNNFDDPQKPHRLRLPAGRGA